MTEYLRFTSRTCVPCKAQGKAIEELRRSGKVTAPIKLLDVEDNFDEANTYRVRSVPTILRLKDGRPVDTLMGNVPADQLEAFLAAS